MRQRRQTPMGTYEQREDGNWHLVEDMPESRFGRVEGPANPVTPYKVAQEREQANAAPHQTRISAANATTAEAQAPYAGTIAEANARKAEAEARKAEIDARSNASGQELKDRIARINAMTEQMQKVYGEYRQNFEGGDIFDSIGESIPARFSSQNSRFNTIAGGLAEQALGAFRVPGSGTQSDAELRAFAEANKPFASDFDGTIEGKLGNIATRLNESRKALGLPEVDFLDKTTPLQVGPGGTQRRLADGERTRTVEDPLLKGVNARVNAMLKAGAKQGDVLRYTKSVGIPPAEVLPALRRFYKWKRENPGYKGDYNVDLEVKTIRVDPATAAFQGIANSPGGAYATAAANSLMMGGLDEVVGLTGGNTEQADAVKQSLYAQYPGAGIAGDVTGGMLAQAGGYGLASKLAPGAVAGAMNLPRVSALNPTALAGNAAYGAGFGALENNQNRGEGALKGAALGAGGGAAARGAVNRVAGVVGPQVGPNVQRLREAGVESITPGQVWGDNGSLTGKIAKWTEDKMTNVVPIVGDASRMTRNRGIREFVNGSINEALSPLGVKIPKGLSGNAAVLRGQAVISRAYNKALAPIRGRIDSQFAQDIGALQQSVATLPQAQQEAFKSLWARKVVPYIGKNGDLTGRGIQQIKRGLDKQIVAMAKSSDPVQEELADELAKARSLFLDFAGRVDPKSADLFKRANQAYMGMLRVNKAAAMASRDGNFSPAQLLTADRQFSGVPAFARGQGRMQGLGQAGAEVLPSQIADSGTGGRAVAALGAAGMGGGAAFAPDMTMDALAGAAPWIAGATAPYLPGMQRLGNKALLDRPDAMRKVAEAMRRRGLYAGHLGAPLAIGSYYGSE